VIIAAAAVAGKFVVKSGRIPESGNLGLLVFHSIKYLLLVVGVVRLWVDHRSISAWILISLGIMVITIGAVAGKFVVKSGKIPEKKPKQNDVKPSANPALEGAKLVFQSKYLLAIVGIVGLYELASTMMDFQFTSTIAHYLDGAAIGKQFSTVFTITNIVSLCVQLFLTSYIMTNFGLTVALMILPVIILGVSGAFLAMPLLWVGSMLNTADNGFAYSINQSAKEALYVPTTRDEKYKAKAFIDMFIQRFAKAIAVGLSLIITSIFADFSSIKWLSLFTIVIVIIWVMAVRYAGSKFKERASSAIS